MAHKDVSNKDEIELETEELSNSTGIPEQPASSIIRPNERLLMLGKLRKVTDESQLKAPSYDTVVNCDLTDKSDFGEPPSYESVAREETSSTSSNSQLPKYSDVGGLADAPPAYHSLFTDSILVRALNALSNNNGDDLSSEDVVPHDFNLSMVMLVNVFLFIFLLIFVLILPVAMVVIGIVYIQDCPVQPRIPIYLIVLGFFQMLECCGRLGYKLFENSHRRNTWRERYRRKDPLIYFVIVWFVIGSMWIYQTNPECQDCVEPIVVKYNHTIANISSTVATVTKLPPKVMKKSVYCNQIVYGFAFWSITSYYGILGFLFLLLFIDFFIRIVKKCCC